MARKNTPAHYNVYRPDSTGGLRYNVADNPRYGTETHCPNGHEFSPENTKIQDNGSRLCRKCHLHRCKMHNRRIRAAARGLTGDAFDKYVNFQGEYSTNGRPKVSKDKIRAE